MNINLPATLTAEWDYDSGDSFAWTIVRLKFGDFVVTEWVYAQCSLNEVPNTPDENELEEFVADKLGAVLR